MPLIHDAGSSKFMRIPFADIRNHQAIPVPADEDVSAIFASSDSQDILFTRQGWPHPSFIIINLRITLSRKQS
jgi:prolyl oligopeptidase